MNKILTLGLLVIAAACAKKNALTEEELLAYKQELNNWHEKRIEELKAPNGWINLVGLYWLEPGINTFGTASENKIVFPQGSLPAKAGYLLVKDNFVSIYTGQNASIVSKGQPVREQIIFNPDSARSAPQLESGSLRWNIIKRDDKIGIRVRDLSSPALVSFKGVERFEINPAWRVEARFERADSSHTIPITNILGQTTDQSSPGTLVFELDGKQLRLDALMGGKDELFIIFADETSGRQTYGGGRFLYVKVPDADGKTTVDFNKAYNPPCVFTSYATCPLPPAQNVLKIAITAGEKMYGDNHHAKAD